MTIKYISSRLKLLYNYELLFNNTQDIKIVTIRVDEFINNLFKNIILNMTNKNISLTAETPKGC